MSEKRPSRSTSRARKPASKRIRLKELLDECPEIIFCCDVKGRWVELSPAIESIIGYRPSDLIGHPCTNLIAPPDRPRFLRTFLRMRRRVPASGDYEFTLTSAHGRLVRLAVRVRLVRRADGELVFVGVGREAPESDATALQHQVDQLGTQAKQARQSAREKSEILAAVSHEIRSPMNGLIGMTQMLLDSSLDDNQRKLVEVIMHSSRALLTLINDALDYSNFDAGKVEIEEMDFDLRVTVEEVAKLLAPMARENGIDLEFHVHHEVPSLLRGDAWRLRQVLLNLVGNAIKFTERGEILVRVERAGEADDDVALKISLSDPGTGIPMEQLSGLFQSITRADAAITRHYGGAGLGLAVSRRLVSLMGGEVGAESEPGLGSTFWFQVKLKKQKEGPKEPAGPDVPLRDLRVLVVDPLQAMRRSMVETLRGWGTRADEAASADVALSRLRAAAADGDPYRLAMIDMQLPGMSGEQLGSTIRSDPGLAETRTLLLTNVGQKGDATRAQSLGFSGYLMRPVLKGELQDAIVQVMRQGASPGDGRKPPLVTRHSLAEARRARARILLVEDDPLNHLVTTWTLRRHGYTVDTVQNAAQAIEACGREPFQLVLMDMKLPDMDGFEAAGALRAQARKGGRIPIVAMTGTLTPAEHEVSKRAGIDAYLMKPVDLGLLCDVVERFTRPAAAPKPGDRTAKTGAAPAGADAAGAAAPVAAQRPLFDPQRLEDSTMGIPALREALLRTFLSDVPPRVARLAEAIAAADAGRIEFEAHGLKGMAAIIGAETCVDAFAEIEHIGRDKRLEAAAGALARAEVEVDRARKYIEGAGGALLAA